MAEGSVCITGDLYQAGTCSAGTWAGDACSAGDSFSLNRCAEGPTNY